VIVVIGLDRRVKLHALAPRGLEAAAARGWPGLDPVAALEEIA